MRVVVGGDFIEGFVGVCLTLGAEEILGAGAEEKTEPFWSFSRIRDWASAIDIIIGMDWLGPWR
jgi:hypothetical protein